jgi:glycosyltransferase involved in cell wall biosynthesis
MEHIVPIRPHDVDPSITTARVILAVKNFAKIPGVCHIGLGVTANNTMRVLRRRGVHTECWSIYGKDNEAELNMLKARLVEASKGQYGHPANRPVTHVIISAPSWIQPKGFAELSMLWPDIMFVQLNHSGAAYLSIDKFGIRNIRDVAAMQQQAHNVLVAANNERVAKSLAGICGTPILYLPNLYDTESFVNPAVPQRLDNTLRIGSFGASRPWKNQLNAAQAAILIAKSLGCNLELYVNSKRPDGGERMIESRNELFHHLPGAKLIEVPWAPWPTFRDITANMHLLVQPSFDETFNVCTADGIAENVPSVTTSAIEWTPTSWWGHAEDPSDLMRVGVGLLHSPHHAVHEARTLLKKYVGQALIRWVDFVTGKAALEY